ncbi:homeodomain superfamily [Exophiala sideris]|uniref:Homeodomain superfamily n=1 Tax=Exophiala sideris TaxID=1016849 RepID=A0ABR0IVG6_9EURO|nr:homeodomain superfamily [Exophiala sideris]KAK5047839.1 homeodomain superfamily [Exophiala sideris]
MNNFDTNAHESTYRYSQTYPPTGPSKVQKDYGNIENRAGVSNQQSYLPTYDTPLSGHPTTIPPTRAANATEGRRGRRDFPKNVTNTLRGWLQNNLDNPYPSENDKESLMRETNLTIAQITNWFMNARRRDPRLRSARNHKKTPRRRLRTLQNASKSNLTSKYEEAGTMTDYL